MSDQYKTCGQHDEHGDAAGGQDNNHGSDDNSRDDSIPGYAGDSGDDALLGAIEELVANSAGATSDSTNLSNGLWPTVGPLSNLKATPLAHQEPPAWGGDPVGDSIQEGIACDPRLALSARLVTAVPTARPQFREDLRQELLMRHPANSVHSTTATALRTNGTQEQTGVDASSKAPPRSTADIGRPTTARGWLSRSSWHAPWADTGRNQAGVPVLASPRTRRRTLVASWAASAVGLALLAVMFVGLSTMFSMRQGSVVAGGTPTPVRGTDIHPQNTADSAEVALRMQPLVTLKSGPARYMAWSPDGSRLAIAEVTKSEYLENYVGNNHPLDTYLLHIYNTGTTEQLGSATLEDISSMQWSPDSSLLAVGLDRFRLKIYGRDGGERYSMSTPFPEQDRKAANGSGWGKFTSANNTGSVAVAWSPDGRLLASAAGEPYSQTPLLSADGAVRLWDPATGQLARTIKVPADPSSMQNDESGHPLSPGWVKRVQWTPGGHLFLPDGASVWDPTLGRRTQELADLKSSAFAWPATTSPYILAGRWSPDGSAFAFADDVFILLCDPVTGQLQRSLPDALPPSPLPTEAPKAPLSQDEGMAVVATAEANAAENDYEPVYSFVWSPDSKQIANVSSGSIRTWGVATGRRLLTIHTQTNSIAWSPDGKVLVSEGFPLTFPGVGNSDQQPPANGVNLWDATSGKLLRHIVDDQAGNFAWSPNGSVLAVSTADGVQLWGIPSSTVLTQSPTPSARVTPAVPPKHTVSAPTAQALMTASNNPPGATPTTAITPTRPTLLATSTANAPPAGEAGACGAWTLQDTPNPGTDNALDAVAATGPNDAWAVGYYSNSGVGKGNSFVSDYMGAESQSLILHWDSGRWAQVPSPDPGSGLNLLHGVVAVSRDDAWAVGSYMEAGTAGTERTLILHWDGTAWQQAPSPNPDPKRARLFGITAVSKNDIWAVGAYGPDFSAEGKSQTLVLHWDGTSWQQVSSPSPGTVGNVLYGVAASAGNNAWAVGVTLSHEGNMPFNFVSALMLHWDGNRWSEEPVPQSGNMLTGVAAGPGAAAWAVGSMAMEGGGDAIILQREGSGWADRPVSLPTAAAPDYHALNGVVALGGNNAWAVGFYDPRAAGEQQQDTLIMHWNGTSWSRYPSPSRDLVPVTSNGVTSKIKVDELKGIGAAPGGAYLWAVGSTERMDTQSQTLVLAYANRGGGCASPTDTVEATVQVKPTATNISSGTPGVAAIQMQPVRTVPAKWANIMAWSPDGSILSTAETDRVQTDTNAPPTRTLEVKLYSMPTGQLLSQATYTNVQALAWSPDSQMLAVGLDRNTIKVLDRSGRERYTLSTPMPDMQSAAQADKESAAWEWAGMSNGGYVRSLSWSPEGHLLASAANDPYSIDPVSPDGAIRIWDMSTGKLARSIRVPAVQGSGPVKVDGTNATPAWVTKVAWSPDGRSLAGGYVMAVGLWDPTTGQLQHALESKSVLGGVGPYVWDFSWSPKGSTLAIVAGGGVGVWDGAAGTLLHTIQGLAVPTSTPGPTARPEELGSPRKIPAYAGPADIAGAVWSPGGQAIAVVDDWQVGVWNPFAGTLLYSLPHTASGLAWSPDDRVLSSTMMTLNDNGTIGAVPLQLWDASNGHRAGTLGPSDALNMAWSPSGAMLATSSREEITLWGR